MYRKPIIAPPWGGWNDSSPSLSLPSNSFRSITNWLIDKGALLPFPSLANLSAPGELLLGGRTFRDALANLHTVVIGQNKVYYYDAGFNAVLRSDGELLLFPQSNNPYAIEVFNNKLYFANGGPPLSHIDGDAVYYKAGDTPGTSFFLGKLAAHLLMVYTIEPTTTSPAQPFPARIRFSASGNGDEWDNTVDFTAGVIDIEDVEDELTGYATINNVGFAFRTNGITSLTPTGISASPFFVENFSIGPSGVGCFYPYSLAVYGTICVFIAENDIYSFSGGAPNPIGGSAKKSIYKDLALASSFTTSSLIGAIQGIGDYLSYWLFIPQNNDTTTSIWIYHFDDNTWVNKQVAGVVRFMSNLVLS